MSKIGRKNKQKRLSRMIRNCIFDGATLLAKVLMGEEEKHRKLAKKINFHIYS